jgi:hypothetical protein
MDTQPTFNLWAIAVQLGLSTVGIPKNLVGMQELYRWASSFTSNIELQILACAFRDYQFCVLPVKRKMVYRGNPF